MSLWLLLMGEHLVECKTGQEYEVGCCQKMKEDACSVEHKARWGRHEWWSTAEVKETIPSFFCSRREHSRCCFV
jgi:hypothetical protein